MRRNRYIGRFFLLILIIMTVGAAFWFYNQQGKAAESKQSFQPVEVQTGTIEESVTAQGKLEPKEYVDVGAQVSGQLDKLHVDIGDTVKAGDLIAEIDPEVYRSQVSGDEARLKTLEAQRDEQKASVQQAQQKLQRNETLFKSAAVSKEVLEDAKTAETMEEAKLKSLTAQIEEAQSTLEGDKAKLNYTKIYAPISGTVVSQTAREGQTLNASQTAPTIVQIADLNTMTVRAQVAEADIMKLKPGMNVYFTTLGSQRRWQGIIRQILPSPEVINDVVLYDVLIDAENRDRQLMTGMSTQIFFVLGHAENVPLIPVSALGKRLPEQDDGGQAYEVRIVKSDGIEKQVIHTGLQDRTNAQVLSGLQAGDKVAVPVLQAGDNAQSGGTRSGGVRGMARL